MAALWVALWVDQKYKFPFDGDMWDSPKGT